jgi:chromosome segregation ATPase
LHRELWRSEARYRDLELEINHLRREQRDHPSNVDMELNPKVIEAANQAAYAALADLNDELFRIRGRLTAVTMERDRTIGQAQNMKTQRDEAVKARDVAEKARAGLAQSLEKMTEKLEQVEKQRDQAMSQPVAATDAAVLESQGTRQRTRELEGDFVTFKTQAREKPRPGSITPKRTPKTFETRLVVTPVRNQCTPLRVSAGTPGTPYRDALLKQGAVESASVLPQVSQM